MYSLHVTYLIRFQFDMFNICSAYFCLCVSQTRNGVRSFAATSLFQKAKNVSDKKISQYTANEVSNERELQS